jgi:hypothetical protein
VRGVIVYVGKINQLTTSSYQSRPPKNEQVIALREKIKGVRAPATIRTMHNALGIHEILFDIFNHVCAITAADGSTKKPNLNPSLVALARTCRAFQEPALDALWLQLDDLTPLLRCLPEDVWVLSAVEEASQDRTEVCRNQQHPG